MNSAVTRRQQIERRRGRQERKNRLMAAFAILGALLLGTGVYLSQQQHGDVQAVAQSSSDDLATDGPFVAEHEMDGGQPIPFLPSRDPQPNIVVPESFYDF